MATKKVILNGETIIDLTHDTATEQDVVYGKTFHGRDGNVYTGSYTPKIQELTITQNGTYMVDESIDGYGPITVEVTSGSVDPTMMPTLLPPKISLDQATGVLTITDDRNESYAEEYDLYLNGAQFTTFQARKINLNSFIELNDNVQINIVAKSPNFNASVRSNTVIWYKTEPSLGTRPNRPSIGLNGAKKELYILLDNNTKDTVKQYDIYFNDELVKTVPFPLSNDERIIDISELVDYAQDQLVSVQAIKADQSTHVFDSYFSYKKPIVDPATDSDATEGLSFTLTNSTLDPYYTCSGIGTATDTEIVVPSYYDNIPVRYIGGFSNNTSITSITLKDNMEATKDSAFYQATNLGRIVFPRTFRNLTYRAIVSTAITTVDFRAGLQPINFSGGQIFGRSVNLYMNDFPATYGSSAFYKYRLTSWHIPSIESFLKSSFSLRSNYLPCSTTTKIYINEQLLEDLVVPDSVTSLPSYLFYNYSYLKTLDLNRISSIGAYCFYNSGLQTVFSSEYLKTINSYAFYSCDALEWFEFKTGLVTLGDYSFSGCLKLNFSSLPNSLISIGNYCFQECSSLDKVTLPNSVRTIGNYAFYKDGSLKDINIPILITTLGDYAFCNCTSLSKIILPYGMSTTGAYAFSGCSKLEQVVLPNGLQTIGTYAFQNCTSLQEIDFLGEGFSIGEGSFSGCSKLKEIKNTDGLFEIDSFAFSGCTSLESLTFGENLTLLSAGFIRNCTSLKTIDISEQNNSYLIEDKIIFTKDKSKVIAAFIFDETQDVFLPSSVTSMNSYAFYRNKVGKLVLSEVLVVPQYCFYQCKELEQVTFSENLQSIESYAFNGAMQEKPAKIIFSNSQISKIDSYAFSSCKISEIKLPKVTTLGSYLFNATQIDTMDLREGITTLPTYFLQSATVDKLYLSKDHTSFYDYSLNNAKINNIYFMSAPPTGTYYSQWGSSLTVGTVHMVDVETWIKRCETSSYTWSSYPKNIINEDLETVTELFISENITKLQNNCLKDMKWLTKLSIPDTVTSITFSSLEGLYSLTDLYFNMALSATGGDWSSGEKWKYMGNSTEEGTTFHLGSAVKRIPGYFFDSSSSSTNTRNITAIDFTDAIELSVIGQYAFRYTRKIKQIILPETITTINTGAFAYCSGMKECDLSNTQITSIPSSCFYSCSNLVSLKLPEELTSLGGSAFYQCTNLLNFPSGTGITTIGSNTFYQCYFLNSFDFSEVTSVGQSAFEYCYSLQELNAEKLTTIGAYAFRYCRHLLTATFGTALTTINSEAFRYCESLREINNYSTLTFTKGSSENGYVAYYAVVINISKEEPTSYYIRDNGYLYRLNGSTYYLAGYEGEEQELILPEKFNDKDYLLDSYCLTGLKKTEKVVFSSTIKTIPSYCLAYNSNLKEVDIPSNITSIVDYSFSECPNLELIKYGAKKATISSNGYAFYNSGKNSNLEFCVQDTVEELPAYLFRYTTYLKTLNLLDAENLVKINTDAFYGVAGGKLSVYIPNLAWWATINVVSITASPFYPSGAKLYVDGELLTELVNPYLSTIPARFLAGYDYLTKVELNTDTLTIEDEAFVNNIGLTELKLGGALQTIKDKAFANCLNLEKIIFDVEDLNYSISNTSSTSGLTPFYRTSGSELELEISNKVKNIAPYLFNQVYNLKTIRFENGAKDITFGKTAFNNSTTQEVYVDSLENWFTFYYDTNTSHPISGNQNASIYINNELVTSLILPETITTVKAWPFYGYRKLTSLTLHDNLVSLSKDAFGYLPNLEEINIPKDSSYWYLEDNILYTSTKEWVVCSTIYLEGNIVLPEEVTFIPLGAFYERIGLTEMRLPDSVTEIRTLAFSKCSNLECINIPKSVITLGAAFSACPKLSKIYLEAENIETASSNVFGGQNSTTGSATTDMTLYVGEAVTKIPNYFMYYNAYLKKVEFSENTVCSNIGEYAFYVCNKLSEISLPESLTTIGTYAFKDCDSLETIIIPEGVATIGYRAFYNTPNLIIMCYAKSRPSGWNSTWASGYFSVVWGYDGYVYTFHFITNSDIVVESITTEKMVQLPVLVQENQVMYGWFTEEDFTGTVYTPGMRIHGSSLPSNENKEIYLYARWVAPESLDGSSITNAIPIAENYRMRVTTRSGLKYYSFFPTQTKTYTYRSYDGTTHADAWGCIMNSSGTQLTYNDDGVDNQQFTMSYNMTAYTVYYLGARLYNSGANGVFDIIIS